MPKYGAIGLNKFKRECLHFTAVNSGGGTNIEYPMQIYPTAKKNSI